MGRMIEVEDRTKKKHWIVRQKDLRVYNPARMVIGITFTILFLPIVILSFIGDACKWIMEKVSIYVADFLASWITAFILRKHKEYPKVLRKRDVV